VNNIKADFIIVGSGAAGLSAALTAIESGKSVIVLEHTDKIGGTSSLSGGQLFVPMNPKGGQIGFKDKREDALAYLYNTGEGVTDMKLAEAFVDHVAPTMEFLEQVTELTLQNSAYPDSLAEVQGGVVQGRVLEPALYPLRRLGKAKMLFRPGLAANPVTVHEVYHLGMLSNFKRFLRRMWPKLVWRMLLGYRGCGQALMAPLFKRCLEKGVVFKINERAQSLVKNDDGRVTGVIAKKNQRDLHYQARLGVILACGGFEWDKALTKKYLPFKPQALPLAKTSLGDNIRLAEQVGAKLDNMALTSIWTVSKAPGFTYEGHDVGAFISSEKTFPHSLFVNGQGKRFVNEASHNAGRAFKEIDPSTGLPKNLPCWCILDSQHRRKYPLLAMKLWPGGKDPDWLIKAGNIKTLAEKIKVDANALKLTIERFNQFASRGKDEDFARGDYAYERYLGDKAAAHPCLGAVSNPPFYAIAIYPSATGTQGGPKTNISAQVLDSDDKIIEGLYAAGNAAAGMGFPNKISAGGTLTPALTFGRLAVLHALDKK
jgi:3-oxosteroid 1-dehydrogenase